MNSMNRISNIKSNFLKHCVITSCSQPSERAQYTLFFLHWALKEAFIKAVGQGLGFDLQRVEFSVGLRGDIDAMREDGRICASAVAVRIDGHARTDWRYSTHFLVLLPYNCSSTSTVLTVYANHGSLDYVHTICFFFVIGCTGRRFELTNLDRRHVLAVAYGPLSEALPSFLAATGWADCTTQPAEAASATATASASATAEGPMPAVQMQRLDALLRLSAP